jgi:hypothetical protein
MRPSKDPTMITQIYDRIFIRMFYFGSKRCDEHGVVGSTRKGKK